MQLIKLTILCLVIIFSADLGATSDALTLEIRGPSASIRSGTDVRLFITTTNTSTSTVTFYDSSPDCDYTVTVLTSAGVTAPQTSYRKNLNCTGGLQNKGRNILTTLKPGESRQDDIGISHLYPMTEPDTYSIRLERTFPGIGHFSSNTIQVQVTK
jgi:hypothetical protein